MILSCSLIPKIKPQVEKFITHINFNTWICSEQTLKETISTTNCSTFSCYWITRNQTYEAECSTRQFEDISPSDSIITTSSGIFFIFHFALNHTLIKQINIVTTSFRELIFLNLGSGMKLLAMAMYGGAHRTGGASDGGDSCITARWKRRTRERSGKSSDEGNAHCRIELNFFSLMIERWDYER